MSRDLALIIEGGTCKGSYVYGAMQALDEIFNDQYGLENFTYMAGSSIGALSIMYSLAGQFHSDGLDIWTNKYSLKRVLNRKSLLRFFSGSPMYNVSYLVDVILKKEHPLDLDKILESKCKFYIPLVDVDTLTLKYYTNNTEISSALLPYELLFLDKKNPNEIYDVIRASAAMPIFYNHKVRIQGRYYITGALISPFPLVAPIPSSAKRICILTKPNLRKPSWIANRLLPSFARGGLIQGSIDNPDVYNLFSAEDRNYHTLLSQIDTHEGDIVIKPDVFLSASDNRKVTLQENMHLGYKNTMALKNDILTLIGKS